MNFQSFKKSGMLLSMLARDFLTMQIGEQVPTISQYVEQFEVSRGVVQDVLLFLQEEKCIILLKRGVKGSILIEKSMRKLFKYTEWNYIKGIMPTPINPYLRSLATAILGLMKEKEIPFSFSYIMGGERRSLLLDNQAYDFCIVSENTALRFVSQCENLEVAMQLSPSIYSPEYALFINKPSATGVEDGMVVSIDSACYDQSLLSRQCAEGKNVTFVEHSAVNSAELFNERKIDVLVTRNFKWYRDDGTVTVLPIPSTIADKYPVLLTNRNNYGIKRLLTACMDPAEIFKRQRAVLADPALEKFE